MANEADPLPPAPQDVQPHLMPTRKATEDSDMSGEDPAPTKPPSSWVNFRSSGMDASDGETKEEITAGGGNKPRQGGRHATVNYSVYRNFSLVAESEDTTFWCTMISGFSSIPPFILLTAMATNSAFGLVFASATDVVSHLMGAHWRLLGRELFKVLAVLLFMRNILLSCYELTVDTIAGYPLLNPTMLARLRNISLDSPRSVVYLLAIMHAYFGMAMFVFSGIGVKFGPLPSDLMWSRYVFLVNVLVKMLLWIFVIRPPSRVTSTAQPGVAHMNRDLREMRRRRRMKHRAILYVGASDSVIFLTYVMVYFAENFYLERHYELEERVLSFNFLGFVLINATQLGVFSFFALLEGSHLLERSRWTETISSSRNMSLLVTVTLCIISAITHGPVPAAFTTLCMYCGLAGAKYLMWACIELLRTLRVLWRALRQTPAYVVPALLAYLVATLKNVREVAFVLVFLACLLWALRVQGKLHYFDGWAAYLTGIMVFLTLHQSFYTQYQTQINDLYKVSLSESQLNISTVLGTTILGLAPKAQMVAPVRPRYPFCDYRFHGLSMMDLASLSLLSYLKPGTPHFDTLFKATLDTRDWKVVHDSGVFAGHRGAVFIDLYSRSRDMSVITVRGTNPKNLADMFQDAMLFNSAFLWDLSGMLVPFLNMIPQQWTSYLVYMSYLPLKLRLERAGQSEEKTFYHYEVEQYTRKVAKERKVVLTGHSLGGGVSKIAATRAGVPVFAISAPGISLSHRIFGVKREVIDELEINLLSAEDVVPKFDRLAGMIMQMRCPSNNPLDCHQIGTTMCELVEKCGTQFSGGIAKGRMISCRNV